jgi:outer membrane phospholipase A
MRVHVNALNATSNSVTWTFPAQLQRRIDSSQGTFVGSIESSSPETNVVDIAVGAFATREYVTAVPDQIIGQVVMEFTDLPANRVVFDVVAAGTGENFQGKDVGTTFKRFVKEVEPEANDKGSEPGRFFREHIFAYEPMYFIALAKSPNAKFQISFAYQLLNHDGPLAMRVPWLKGFRLGYTQLSLWDWNSSSGAFYDTSYKPEIFYTWKNVLRAQPTNWFELDLQGGLKHESNGKGGDDSRSLNIVYLRPTLTLGRDEGLQLAVQPRVWVYLGDLSDNPDIADYRGYADLRAVLGWKRGLQLSALGRMEQDGNHRSLQLDATYPTMRFFGSFSLYLDVQYFYGYGESLLGYDQKTEQLRVGLALFR